MWDEDQVFDSRDNVIWTDVAQICLNGDIINDSTQQLPHLSKKYCPKCGEPTLSKCLNCNTDIAGEIHYPHVFGSHSFKRPSYCIECGKAYPWMTQKLKAAKELAAELDELSADEKSTLEKSIDDITKDTTQAEIGATRIKKIMLKVGSTTGEIVQKVLIEVASETAKKILLGK